MAEVSQNPDPKRIQQAIADQLGLEFPEKEAARLRERLKEKSILVILDDVWKEMDLKAIGIPFGDTDGRHCSILLISRDKRVCSVMKSEKYICIEPLSYVEARILFWKTVDDEAKRSQFELIAERIVEKCDGLSVAIFAIAKKHGKVRTMLSGIKFQTS